MPVILHRIIIILSLAFLSSCSGERLPKIAEGGTILAFGDSLTAGVGVKLEDSYPNKLASLTNLRVINAGVSGETTKQGLNRFKSLLEEHQPDLIILLEGGNDILRNLPKSETKNNLAGMIGFAKQKQIPVLLIGVPEKKLFSSSASFYQELAQEHQLVLDDNSIAKIIKNPSLKSDSVHFNRAGYKQLAENIYQLLRSSGAVD